MTRLLDRILTALTCRLLRLSPVDPKPESDCSRGQGWTDRSTPLAEARLDAPAFAKPDYARVKRNLQACEDELTLAQLIRRSKHR